jgi:hypothetical protein
MFINVGAYVDEGTMVDSHVLVGSCAQIGKNVHLSAAADDVCDEPSLNIRIRTHAKGACVRHPTKS